jgi:diguanylate cyclase (GGDEF)-like protein
VCIRYTARHDPLTGLPNRLFLTEHAGGFLATPRPAAAMMDLNRFKLLNDTLGHAAGDAVLVEFAERVTAVLGHQWLVPAWVGTSSSRSAKARSMSRS